LVFAATMSLSLHVCWSLPETAGVVPRCSDRPSSQKKEGTGVVPVPSLLTGAVLKSVVVIGICEAHMDYIPFGMARRTT